MNKSNTMLTSKKGMSTLARAKFAPGMLLQHEDLEQLNDYTRDLSRLMFRSLFGCGVICGLVVEPELECGNVKLTIGAGVALSCAGDPIEVPSDVSVVMARECHPNMGDILWVVLCGTTKCCAPRTSMCESDDDDTKSECTREREGYEIRVESKRPPCVCGCPEPKTDQEQGQSGDSPNQDTGEDQLGLSTTEEPKVIDCKCADPTSPCYEHHYNGECGCHCDECSDCDCKCVLLARVYYDTQKDEWLTDHSVRRFVRPVLMRDPQVEKEKKAKQAEEEEEEKPKQQDQKGQTAQELVIKPGTKSTKSEKKIEPTPLVP
jgi:hypothetical protein